jgi:hypothetical protein
MTTAIVKRWAEEPLRRMTLRRAVWLGAMAPIMRVIVTA